MRVKLGRNKQDYPFTGKWYLKASGDFKRIDYVVEDDEELDLDNFGGKQTLNGYLTIKTETPHNYMVKDLIILEDGSEYLVSKIIRHRLERKEKEISMYLKPRIEYYELVLGSK